MTPAELAREIARCDREIAEAQTHADAPAYLTALWELDWRGERAILERMSDDQTQ